MLIVHKRNGTVINVVRRFMFGSVQTPRPTNFERTQSDMYIIYIELVFSGARAGCIQRPHGPASSGFCATLLETRREEVDQIWLQKGHGRTGSSTLVNDKKLTLPFSTTQNFRGMPP